VAQDKRGEVADNQGEKLLENIVAEW